MKAIYAASLLGIGAVAKSSIVGEDGLIRFDQNNALLYTPTNDPAIVDFSESLMNWDDFVKTTPWTEEDQISLPNAREALYKYAKGRLYIPRRAPKRGDSFSD